MPNIVKFNKDIFEIVFFARAGQGAKTAAEIVAQAAVGEGKYVQAFPNFGPERSGAPMKTYVRISGKPIRTHEPIINPDAVVVLDDTLLSSENVTENLDRDEVLIVNTAKGIDEIGGKLSGFQGNPRLIDGNKLSLEIIGQPHPNSVMLGKLVGVTEVVKLESIINKFRELFEAKMGKEMTDKNIQAIEKGYDTI